MDFTINPVPCTNLPKQFHKAVALLKRPYIYISKAEYDALIETAYQYDTDVFEDEKGRQYTIGTCDGNRFAIMPLTKRL